MLTVSLIVVALAFGWLCFVASRRAKYNAEGWKSAALRYIELQNRFVDVDVREARFRQALGYYADEETWVAPGRAHSPAFRDRGRTARAALDDR